jgi:P-type conjugative transfer protein TrbG
MNRTGKITTPRPRAVCYALAVLRFIGAALRITFRLAVIFLKTALIVMLWCSIMAAFAGCAQQKPPPLVIATEASPDVPSASTQPTPIDPLSVEPEPVQAAVRAYQQTGEAPIIPSDRILYPYDLTDKPPTLICAPLHVTDLTLAKGETVTDVATGDSERWLIQVAGSGDPQNPLPHVLIKPKDAPLSSNLVIMTNRRTYRLNLVARRTANFTLAAGFYFPRELLTESSKAKRLAADPPEIPKRASLVADLAQKELNLSYSISGPNVTWKPIRAFDDGAHTYIQMAAGMKASDAPALLISGPSGDGLANYRVAGNYYIVDRLFDQAVLLAGVGREQDRVTITYSGAPRGGGV